MNALCKTYQRVADVVEGVCIWFASAVLVALLGINFYSIVADLCLPWSAPWLEEVSALLFSWTTFIAAGVIVRYGGHVSVDMFVRYLSGPFLLLARLVSFGCMAWVAWVMTRYGMLSVRMSRQSTVYLDIPMSWCYAPIAVCGVLLIFFGLAALLPHARKNPGAEDELPQHLV